MPKLPIYFTICILPAFFLVPCRIQAFTKPINARKTHSLTTEVPRHSKTRIKMRPFTQVISDVDDTLKSSGGVKIGDVALGGIDVQYSRGEFYPGVFQFMLELSLSSITTTATDDKIYPPKVAVLTARAVELKAALELKEDSKLAKEFRKTGENHSPSIDNWGLGPVLYGSVAVSRVLFMN